MACSTGLSTPEGFWPGRTKPGVGSARYIASEVWETVRDDVAEKYIDDSMPLKDLAKYMKLRYGFDASLSQWKKQLSRWDMRRNLNASDAAHILRLYREAEAADIQRMVFCNGLKKTRENISSYISKSERFDSEVALLHSINGEPNPAHITFQDTRTLPQTPPRAQNGPCLAQTTPGAAGSPWTPAGSGQQSPEAPLQPTPASERSTASSAMSLPLYDLSLTEGSTDRQHERSELGAFQNSYGNMVEGSFLFEADMEARAEHLQQILAPTADEQLPMWAQVLARGQNANNTQSNEMLYGVLSGTPIAIGRILSYADEPMNQDSTARNQPVPTITEIDVHGDQFMPQNDYGTFLSHCFSFCIWKGQGFLADEMFAKAMTCFEDMVIHNSDDTLTALNVLVTILESHGQLQLPTIILERAQHIAEKRNDRPLALTIRFMLSSAKRVPLPDLAKFVDSLHEAYTLLVRKFGPRSKSALTASYNLSWAFAAHQTEDGYRQALEILAPLRGQCEVTFGLSHVTTCCTVATLARMCFRLKRPKEAEMIIAELINRLEGGLPRFHPYRLEARNRQALFLKDLGDLEKAEAILHEVIKDRFAILGSQNPRSRGSFEQLQKILREQGRESEIDDLYQYFLTAVNREFEENQWKAY